MALTDENGITKTVYSYDPFGNTAIGGEATDQPFQYTARENDGTGLYYYRARYFSPEMGRFVSKDPILFKGGQQNLYGYVDSVGKVLSTNLYQYAGDDPVNLVDPTGLFGMSTGFEATGGLFGFGGTIGLYGNYAHDPNLPWYQGWSSSVTFVLGGGAAGSVYGASAGASIGINNACNVKQLEGTFINGGRLGLGAFSLGGYRSPDGIVSGGDITVGPSIGFIGAMGGGSYTWTLGGGSW